MTWQKLVNLQIIVIHGMWVVLCVCVEKIIVNIILSDHISWQGMQQVLLSIALTPL